MKRFDKIALLILGLALLLWVAAPVAVVTGVGMLLAGAMHLWRLVRWTGHRTGAQPSVLVLYAGYVFLPLGALAIGTAILWPGVLGLAAAQHAWMAGAIGLMTLAVMTPARLGHTGRALSADTGIFLIYLMMILAVLARVLAGPMPALAPALHAVSGLAWIAAFGGFSTLYGRLLLRARPER